MGAKTESRVALAGRLVFYFWVIQNVKSARSRRRQSGLVGAPQLPCRITWSIQIAELLEVIIGGWGGIRTHEELPPAGFQDRCLKPLGHPSAARDHRLQPDAARPARSQQERAVGVAQLIGRVWPAAVQHFGQRQLRLSLARLDPARQLQAVGGPLTSGEPHGATRDGHHPGDCRQHRTDVYLSAGRADSGCRARGRDRPAAQLSRRRLRYLQIADPGGRGRPRLGDELRHLGRGKGGGQVPDLPEFDRSRPLS